MLQSLEVHIALTFGKKCNLLVCYTTKAKIHHFLEKKIQIVFAEWRNNCTIFPHLEPYFWGPGFFYLENHGIHSSVFENAIDQMNGFFTKCSYEDKLEILNHGYAGAPQGKSSKGYVPPGMEGNYQKGCVTI